MKIRHVAGLWMPLAVVAAAPFSAACIVVAITSFPHDPLKADHAPADVAVPVAPAPAPVETAHADAATAPVVPAVESGKAADAGTSALDAGKAPVPTPPRARGR